MRETPCLASRTASDEIERNYLQRNCDRNLVRYHRHMLSNITSLLEHNEAFAKAGTWRNAPRLPFLPFKGLYVITCIDPRTDPADFLGLAFADAIVARTVGGRVTDAVIQDIAYIGYLVETFAPEGPYFEAALIHHTDCGSRMLEQPDVLHGFAGRSGYDETMLARLPATVPAETVKSDVAKLLAAPQISSCIGVSGHVYHTETGRLETVAAPRRKFTSAEK